MTDLAGGVRARLARLLREAPKEAEAIEFDGQWWSWGQVAACAEGLDAALTGAGLGAGARIGIVLENRPEHVASLVGVIATDRCVVTLSPLQPPERLARDIERSALPVVLASAEVLARPGVLAAASSSALVLRLAADGTVAPAAGAIPDDASGSISVAVEMLTSGTTGPPKRIRLTDLQLDSALVSSGQVPAEGRLLAKGVVIVATPVVHIGGMWGVLAGLHAGRRIVLLPRFQLDSWVAAVEKHRPRVGGLVPAALRAVLDSKVPPDKLSSLVVITCGTASCPPELADDFFRIYGARVLMTYGATEFAGAVAGWTLPLYDSWGDRKVGSTGRAYPGVDLRVTSPEGEVLPAGTTGILEIRTSQSPQGANAWQPTSDLAALDDDGFLWIRGRADDAIIRGGFKVHPDQVREVLEKHPSVAEATVVGLPDVRLGQLPVAVVELLPGEPVPAEAELVALCRTELTPYEVPARVLCVDALPRTAAMKVSREDVLELFGPGTVECSA